MESYSIYVDYYAMRRPLSKEVSRSKKYRTLLTSLKKLLGKHRLRHGLPNTLPRSDLYFELGRTFAEFGQVPGLYAACARALAPRLPKESQLSGSEYSRCYRYYKAYENLPHLSPLARDISLSHNWAILEAYEDPTAWEFYLRLVRNMFLRSDELADFIELGLYEQLEEAYGRPSDRTWLDEVLGNVEPMEPTRQMKILELLHSDPTLGYPAIARAVGMSNNYVRAVAVENNLERIGDYSDDLRDRVRGIAAKTLGLSKEEYLARRSAGLRWCSSCKQWLKNEAFERPRTGAPQGSFCILCLKEYMASLVHKRRLENGEVPGWIRYQEWWEGIYERLEEMPPDWQQAFLEEDVPNLRSMARILGMNPWTFRLHWLAAGFPSPPVGSFVFRWKLDPATLLAD